MRRAVGSGGDKRWLRDAKGRRVVVEPEGEGDGAMSTVEELTMAGLNKETPMEGVIPAQKDGKFFVMASLKNPLINGEVSKLNEDSADFFWIKGRRKNVGGPRLKLVGW